MSPLSNDHPVNDDVAQYPAAPWRMVGQLWLSVFRLREAVDPALVPGGRPAGIYGVAFVSYEPGSPLTYSELLVARAVPGPGRGRRVSITDIWVDSPASMAGGRELWAIPKGLCDFDLESSHTGPLTRTEWSAVARATPHRRRAVHRRLPGRRTPAVPGQRLAAAARAGRPRGRGHDGGNGEVAALPRALGLRAGRTTGLAGGRATAGVVPDGRLPDVVRLSRRGPAVCGQAAGAPRCAATWTIVPG